MKYQTILYWNEEDGVYVADVPEFPGCSAHGDTQERVLENVKDAMEFWFDTARELGRNVPEPKGHRLMVA